MSEREKRKTRLELDRAGLADLLRRAAEAVEAGRIEVGEFAAALPDGADLSIKARGLGSRLQVSLKVKGPAPGGPGEAGEGEGRPRYKSLKKSMKSTFRAMRETLGAGGWPEAGIVAAFLSQGRLMIRYPGKGDPGYPAFERALSDLERAQAAGDRDGLAAALATLERQKKACHKEYA